MDEPGFEGERPDEAVDWHQLGVLVLDGSISMTWDIEELKEMGFSGKKREAVNMAVRALFNRFKASRKKKNFTFAVVKFHEEVTDEMPLTPAEELDSFGNYDPTASGTSGTFIGSGLERAKSICEQFFADHAHDNLPTTARVLLMTDGQCSQPERTKEIAKELKSNPDIKLATAFFATKGEPQQGAALLRSICSEPVDDYFAIVYDPETLRKFWVASLAQTREKRT